MAVPTRYGDGVAERVATLAPGGVDAVLDRAGPGSLPDLVAIVGDPRRLVTVVGDDADRLGVHQSRSAGRGADPQAVHGLTWAATFAEEGRFPRPLAGVFALSDAAAAGALSESGRAHGKIVLTP